MLGAVLAFLAVATSWQGVLAAGPASDTLLGFTAMGAEGTKVRAVAMLLSQHLLCSFSLVVLLMIRLIPQFDGV